MVFTCVIGTRVLDRDAVHRRGAIAAIAIAPTTPAAFAHLDLVVALSLRLATLGVRLILIITGVHRQRELRVIFDRDLFGDAVFDAPVGTSSRLDASRFAPQRFAPQRFGASQLGARLFIADTLGARFPRRLGLPWLVASPRLTPRLIAPLWTSFFARRACGPTLGPTLAVA